MTNQEIVAKLWNLCNVLRDDGITYHQYVTELTYILFLKMAKETGTEDKIPEKYRWDRLAEKDGLALKNISLSSFPLFSISLYTEKANALSYIGLWNSLP